MCAARAPTISGDETDKGGHVLTSAAATDGAPATPSPLPGENLEPSPPSRRPHASDQAPLLIPPTVRSHRRVTLAEGSSSRGLARSTVQSRRDTERSGVPLTGWGGC